MKGIPNSRYTKEFRVEAVRRVVEGGESAGEAAKQLSLPKSTLENWVRAFKAGKLGAIGVDQRPVSERDQELSRLKRELVEVRMERDLLKKAAAYFAKESLPGTRS